MTAPEIWPTVEVFQACCRGLDTYERQALVTSDHGGTADSVEFASSVRDGFPVSVADCARVIAAHETIWMLPKHARMLPRVSVSRLLWGGDNAYDWATAAVNASYAGAMRPSPTPPPQQPPGEGYQPFKPHGPPGVLPIAAAVTAPYQQILDDLTGDIVRIEQETIVALRAAFEVSYRAALRHAGIVAQRKLGGRVPVAAQAGAGLEGEQLNQIRARLETVHPYEKWMAAGPILAAIPIDLDQTVQSELDDYEATAESILERNNSRLKTAISSRLGLEAAVVAGFFPERLRLLNAAKRLSHGLLDWVRERLSGKREPEDLPEIMIPDALFTEALGTAGGVTDALEGMSVGFPTTLAVLKALGLGRINSSLIPEGTNFGLRWTWRRGDPRVPYPPHVPLEGASWTNDVERFEAVGDNYPADHRFCQCYVELSWATQPVLV